MVQSHGDALVVPTIRGATVTLRPFARRDAPAVQEASSDVLIPLITSVPAAASELEAFEYVERQHERARTGVGYSFAIDDRSDVAVGQIGLWPKKEDPGRASVGYWIRPSARRRGLASGALQTLMSWAISLPELHRFELYVEPWNIASCRTAALAGFEREGLLRSWQVIGDQRRDMFVYSRIAPAVRP